MVAWTAPASSAAPALSAAPAEDEVKLLVGFFEKAKAEAEADAEADAEAAKAKAEAKIAENWVWNKDKGAWEEHVPDAD